MVVWFAFLLIFCLRAGFLSVLFVHPPLAFILLLCVVLPFCVVSSLSLDSFCVVALLLSCCLRAGLPGLFCLRRSASAGYGSTEASMPPHPQERFWKAAASETS